MLDVVNRLRSGDEQAFSHLFHTYWKKLFSVAYRRVNDEQLAQDITQDVFMQLWDKRETLNINSSNIEYYLLKSIKNKVINHYTSAQVKQSVLNKVMERMEQIQDEIYDPKRYQELENYVDDQIEQFPQTMKAVFLMRSEQLSIREIASRLNLSEQTVKNNTTEALHRLKRSLHKKFSKEDILIISILALLTQS